MAAEVEELVRQVPEVSTTTLIGGLSGSSASNWTRSGSPPRGLAPAVVMQALQKAGVSLPAGSVGSAEEQTLIETGDFLRTAEEVGAVVLAAPMGKPVHLRDVAPITDGAAGAVALRVPRRARPRHRAGGHPVRGQDQGRQRDEVADAVLHRDRGGARPAAARRTCTITVTRDYGETAKEKSDELILHLILATVSVVILMALFLGLRDSLVVAVAVPVTLALTLLVYYLWGYTLNRVTLFALIFSIGILVDDAIVVVENIHRHLKMGKLPPLQAAVFAVDEVGNPTILATFTVIAAILPMAFVAGLMGPYMRPIPVGASFAMLISLLVAFIISPWLSYRLLGPQGASTATTSRSRPRAGPRGCTAGSCAR